jgi:transposase
VFVDEVLAELEAMAKEGARPLRSGPKPPLAGAALRKAAMAIWCVCFCGMQWRAIGRLCDIPFGTLYGLFARWTRLGLWRRLLDRLRRTWRRACGDSPEPSAVVIDSRSCRSAPSCFDRGIDGGKKIRGVKIHVAVDKYGMPLAIDVSPANRHDTKGIVPVLRTLAEGGFQGAALGDLGYRASVWPTSVRRSASPSRRLPADAKDGSSRPASAGRRSLTRVLAQGSARESAWNGRGGG